ncbi:CHASE2 domain-containing protein [Brunnivagina elsteri]|uniref:Transmembrane sensor domain-containing protein n=1 Tax=Brunnivagina elsteri CCALA 953 TaxID=987040 RepID=A0A2A2TI89_9CYAN|nr:CHASE2 domain-containing protein [Calothrix elsteri]PAX53545.1 transmembrane sensor domain-containing protein [Calothrix elsteri CCALA 953]
MGRLVTLNLSRGNLYEGFPDVTMRLGEPNSAYQMKFSASLPPAPEIPEIYRNWQSLYSGLCNRLCLRHDNDDSLEIEEAYITNISEFDINDLCQQFSRHLNIWLNSSEFRKIDQQIRTQLKPVDEIRFIFETNDKLLRKLPWHLWNFFEDYPFAEVALSASEYQISNKIALNTNNSKVKKNKVLAIFGNNQGIDIGKDKYFLEKLSNQAEIKFLIEPNLSLLNEHLWQEGWDILFFAGHSSNQNQGKLYINQTDTITIEQLRYAIRQAISRGLKLAIFNSCDGLGLAQQLEDLHIPQVIVMRELVPDAIAQEFLKNFLTEFSHGRSLYTSVRLARERLQGLENQYPCATWLPIICQNPAEPPMEWQTGDMGKRKIHTQFIPAKSPQLQVWEQPNHRFLLPRLRKHQRTIPILLLMSFLIAIAIMGMRHYGGLQPWELRSYDHLQRIQAVEKPDPRLLLITVDEADIKYQIARGMDMRWSLSDQALSELLQKLDKYEPEIIGIDIYRDFPVDAKYPNLVTRFQQDRRLIGVCKISATNDSTTEGTAPPPNIPKEGLGFSDFVADDDGIPRRQLLHTRPPMDSPCTANLSFGYQLARRYLKAKGLKAEINSQGYLQIGNQLFRQLQSHSSGYQRVDASGYQILLKYRPLTSLREIAPQVSLRDILSNQVKPELIDSVKNRVVIIGVTASSTSDRWRTPFSNIVTDRDKQIPGVYLQAQMVSHILSAVLDRRALIWWWSEWIEGLWVLAWALLGAVLAFSISRPLPLGLGVAFGLFSLSGICYFVFTQAGWIPLVPAAIAFVLCAVVIKK